MKLALIGVGQAGGTLVDQFAQHDADLRTSLVSDAFAVNTSKPDLALLRHLPRNRRLLVGQREVEGHGVGLNNELAMRLVTDDISEVLTVADDVVDPDVDAILLMGSLGGGTGSGGLPVVVSSLKSRYDQPVYCVGVLPHTDEGTLYALNAARSLRTLEEHADGIILFDNDAVDVEEGEEAYPAINADIITRLGAFFSLDTLGDKMAFNDDPIETDELHDLLQADGTLSLGYRTDAPREPEEQGFFKSLFGSEPEIGDADEHAELLTTATLSDSLSIPVLVDRTKKAVVVLVGPDGYVSESVLKRASEWVQGETLGAEVIGRIFVPEDDVDELAALVVLSGSDESKRLRELTQNALDALRFGGNVRELSGGDRMELFMQESPSSSEAKIEPLF
jgi:cell division GTPase FtsZ